MNEDLDATALEEELVSPEEARAAAPAASSTAQPAPNAPPLYGAGQPSSMGGAAGPSAPTPAPQHQYGFQQAGGFQNQNQGQGGPSDGADQRPGDYDEGLVGFYSVTYSYHHPPSSFLIPYSILPSPLPLPFPCTCAWSWSSWPRAQAQGISHDSKIATYTPRTHTDTRCLDVPTLANLVFPLRTTLNALRKQQNVHWRTQLGDDRWLVIS